MRALVPETGMTIFRKEMDRLMDRFWDGDESPASTQWAPKIDISETKEAFIVKAEVPGIEPKDIQVSLENGLFIVRGEKKQDMEQKDERFYRAERSYGSFVRSLRLPTHVDAAKASATFKHGLLTIMLPKVAEARGQSIPIKTE